MLVSKTLPRDVAFLVFVHLRSAPGSKARANPLGVATSISISKSKPKKCSLQHKWYKRVFQRIAQQNQKQLEKNNHFSPTVFI